ncbi:lysozyme inhibitor LprI family protein [Herminiimonas sp. NPDC097707]|uniref:lysozyme inhibitor LprI family protein n=1 Tax=Herminiimonas sp. NPDC097707 TaxID=3364007 RepID=UPI00383ADA21
MKTRHFITCALLAASGSAMAQEQAESLKDCDKTQSAMNMCARHRYDLADQALNRQYTQNMKTLQEAAGKQRLRDAQGAWLVFRDKDCLVETGPREESGSIWPLQHFSCLERHTVRRTKDLKSQACGMEGCAKQ